MPRHFQPQTQPGPYTWREFTELGEDDPRELLDGHLVEIEVPTRTHERIVAVLIALLSHWGWSRNAGEVLASGYKIRIDDRRGTMPDVQFYRRGNLPRGQEKGLEQGRPDLVVEVISPSSRSKDSVQKLHDYAAIGVPEFWLLDPEARTLERLILRDGLYSIVEALEGDVLFRPESFEGLEIDLGRLWHEPEE
jgi:Uma2 family endonuclease